jgi:hypothetical protein
VQSYIVRIYRWGRKRSRRLVGVVEEAEGNGKRAFGSLDELWQILAASRRAFARRKAPPGRPSTLRGIAAGGLALLLSLGAPVVWPLAADSPPVRGKSLGGIPIRVEAPASRVEVEVFDANPLFLPRSLAATLYPPYGEASLEGAASLGSKRIGAVLNTQPVSFSDKRFSRDRFSPA